MGIRSKPANKNWYANYPFKKKKSKGNKSYKWQNGRIVEIETNKKPKLRELI